MMFNKDLFTQICQEYGVRFSKEYDSPMLDENGIVKELTLEEIKLLFLPAQEVFLYRDKIDRKFSVIIDVSQDDLLAA